MTDRNGRAYLSGATSYPIPDSDMQAADQGLQELVDSGPVSKGMPEKQKGRGARGE